MPIEREFILVPKVLISEKGLDFRNKIITEDFDYTGYKIIHRKKMYDWGNRYHDRLELFCNGKFIMDVSTTQIHLLKL